MARAAALGDILTKTLDDLDLSTRARKYAVFSIWRKALGDISRYARPRRIQGDVLYVATASSVWSQELTFMGESILAKINGALGDRLIREIRFSEHLWSSQDSGETSSASVRRAMAVDGSGARPEEPSAPGADVIGDPALKRAFCRVATVISTRRQYLLASGYKVCRACGCIYPSAKKECPACRMRGESRGYARAIAILESRPEIPPAELARLSGLSDQGLADLARRDTESRLVTAIRYHLASSTRDGAPASRPAAAARAELAPAIRKLAALRALQPVESMDAETMQRVVGRRLMGIVMKE